MKTIEIEFAAGENVYQMINNKPVLTKIRAYAHKSSMIKSKSSDGKTEDVISETTVYATFARPNDPVPASALGRSIEELSAKVFGTSQPQPEPIVKEELQDAGAEGEKEEGSDFFNESIVNRS